LKDYNT